MADVPKVIRDTDAPAIVSAKTLLRTARFGSLAVLDIEHGAPSVSRVGVATDLDGSPLLLVSMLSPHTRAMLADPRCALLVGEPAKGDPLAHPRLSINAMAHALERETPECARAERRYLNHNPKASLYAGLSDFRYFRLKIAGASLNGGFGKAYRLSDADLAPEHAANHGLEAAEQGAVDHMNADHADAVDLYAHHFAGAIGTGWRLASVDAEGIVLARLDDVRRVDFPAPLDQASELRSTLVEMVRTGRASTQSGSRH